MPVAPLQGALQLVIVWKMLRLASRLTKRTVWPGRIVGGRPLRPVMPRSPWP